MTVKNSIAVRSLIRRLQLFLIETEHVLYKVTRNDVFTILMLTYINFRSNQKSCLNIIIYIKHSY